MVKNTRSLIAFWWLLGTIALLALPAEAFTGDSHESGGQASWTSSPRPTSTVREVRIFYPQPQESVRHKSPLQERVRFSSRGRRQGRISRSSSGTTRYYHRSHPASHAKQSNAVTRNSPRRYANIPGTMHGVASWYGREFHGRHTANGEVYNMHAHTAAHRTLPFGTIVRVTNLRNGRQALVRINDRGPFVPGREIDLSYGAARDLGMLEAGVVKVRLDVLSV